uniref:Uncharacterized protein n=1 Tax=Ananas comosus var. bracteatus TaxID=296719 RepID=A0A6V7NW97_ANACO|nr:unnamed protein product [Ananas comosus var. bracteatus]
MSGRRCRGRVRTGSARFQMTEDRLVAGVRRGLHDHALRVVGLRGGSSLGDLISRRQCVICGDHTGLDFVSRERAGVLDVDSRGIAGSLSPSSIISTFDRIGPAGTPAHL